MLVELKRKKPRLVRRARFLLIALALLGVVLLGDALRDPVAQWYRDLRQRRAMDQAQEFLANKDFNNAFVALQTAARANPDNPAAWRMAAETLESAGSNYAVGLRQQVVAANPDSLPDQLALAATALRFQDAGTAAATLASVAARHRGRPEYLKIAAALAYLQRRNQDADVALERLLALEPDNLQMRLNRATIRLRHPAAATAARAELVAMAAPGRPLRVAALRELARDAGVRGRPAEGLAWSRQLIELADAAFDDHLLHLNLLRLVPGSPEARSAEANLASRASANATDSAAYALWLMVQNRGAQARQWIATLPAPIRDDPRVETVSADCLASLRDWPSLAVRLKAGAWGPISGELVDLALSARTLHERQRYEVRNGVWRETLELARSDLPALRVLLRLALYWQWPGEAEATLGAIARGFPQETWAFDALVSAAYTRKDTPALKTAYSLYHQAQPSNRRVAGDWAMITLLTEPSPADTRAKAVALELYRSEPNQPFFATTHAFSLHQQQRTDEALEVMQKLSLPELQVPGRALYHALFLASAGQRERARRCVERASTANLLPEEAALLETARRLCQRGS